jgi:hypothetical protein
VLYIEPFRSGHSGINRIKLPVRFLVFGKVFQGSQNKCIGKGAVPGPALFIVLYSDRKHLVCHFRKDAPLGIVEHDFGSASCLEGFQVVALGVSSVVGCAQNYRAFCIASLEGTKYGFSDLGVEISALACAFHLKSLLYFIEKTIKTIHNVSKKGRAIGYKRT